MKALVLLAVALTACADDTDPRWQLRHDRIIAIRTSPSGVVAGQTAVVDGLVTSAATGPVVATPTDVTVSAASPSLAITLGHSGDGSWRLTAPADLGPARVELGLGATDPVPVELITSFAFGDRLLTGTKTVLLGIAHDNPAVGTVTIDGVPMADPATVSPAVESTLEIDTAADDEIRWFTSCGSLNADDDQHQTVLTFEADDPRNGQLAVVVRDQLHGVAWKIWPISAMESTTTARSAERLLHRITWPDP